MIDPIVQQRRRENPICPAFGGEKKWLYNETKFISPSTEGRRKKESAELT